MANRYVDPRPQYLDDAGDPLIEGKVFIYNSGSSVFKDLFFDINKKDKAPNPVILTASGRMKNTFFDGSAKAVLTNADESQFWNIDPINSSTGEGQFSDWNSVSVFNVPDIVIGGDDLFYMSITNNNQGNAVTDTLNWSQIKFTGVYNANETYSINDIAQGSDGLLYVSKTNSNAGNDPVSDVTNWGPASNNADTTIQAYAFFIGVS